jgi:hypothetical protein
MQTPPKTRFFNVYDSSGEIRSQVDRACKEADLSRSQIIRHALKEYFSNRKLG